MAARTPLVPAEIEEARTLRVLADVRTLMDAAMPNERQAVVGSLFDKVWVRDREIVAVTPRADVGPVIAGLAKVKYGCLDGVPDGFRLPHTNSRGMLIIRYIPPPQTEE